MANQYVQAYSINPDTYADNLDAAIELMKVRPDEFSAETEQFFHPIAADSTSFKMSSVGSALDLPKESLDEDDIPVSAPATGYDSTFNLVNYRQKVQIADTFMRADRFGKGSIMAGGLVTAQQRMKEYLRVAVFANAFSGVTGADGLALCSDSHVPENPRGSLRDNLTTGVLNYDNWQAMRLLADQQVNELGYPAPGVIRTLLVPPALRQVAMEIRGADRDPDTSLNTKAVLNDFEVVIGHFLSSSTAWFGFTDKMGVDKGMYYFHLLDTDVQDCKPSDNPDIVWAKRSKSILTYGFDVAVDYVYGSAGT